MPSIGSSLGLTLPEVGDTSWGGPINTIFSSLITAVEGVVSSGALLVNSNVDMSSYALRNTNYASFITQAGTLSTVNSVYFYGGNFYITNGSGTAVQLTSGASIVAASGNIGNSGGTYAAGTIEVDWDGTNYNFKSGAGADSFAPIQVDEVRLRDGSSNYIALESATGLSGNATVTFPALPGSTQIAQISSSGVISYSNTVANAATFSSTVSTGELSATKINFSTDRILYVNLLEYNWNPGLTYTNFTSSESTGFLTTVANSTASIYLPVHNIGRITEFYYSYKTSTTANEITTFTATLYGPGTSTTVASTANNTSRSTSEVVGPTSSACTHTGPGFIKISTVTTGTITITIMSIVVKYDWV